MEGELDNALPTLPDELVERIISRMPFPSIFTARCLSKSWLARFSPISSLRGDEAKKSRAISFQKLVRERCSSWETFSPVSVEKKTSVAYNWVSATWQRVPSLCHVPWVSHDLLINGALLLAHDNLQVLWPPILPNMTQVPVLERARERYVANLLTGSWKRLPPPPNMEVFFCETLLTDVSSETYQVISFMSDYDQGGNGRGYFAQIYDSESASWSSKQLDQPSMTIFALSNPALFNGVLYMVADFSLRYILAYDVEAGTWEELNLSFDGRFTRTESIKFIVCDSNLMMVFRNDDLHVLKVDLVSNRLLRVASGPPKAIRELKFNVARRPVGNGSSIFFGRLESDGRMVAYNTPQEKWICFDPPPIDPETKIIDFEVTPATPSNGQGTKNKVKHYEWCLSAFQPGLNPFMEV